MNQIKKLPVFLLALLVFLSFYASATLGVDKTAALRFAAVNVQTTPIDYTLAYPGILPDSPFYFLKVARDRVISFLIQSSANKAFYTLLLSDKRLAAGKVLIDTGKATLGTITIVNSEEYFSQAVDEATRARTEGIEIRELLAKLSVAAVKHQEVISDLLPKVSGNDAISLNKAFAGSQKSYNRVQDLMKNDL